MYPHLLHFKNIFCYILQEPNTVQTFGESNDWVNKNNTTVWYEDFMRDAKCKWQDNKADNVHIKVTLMRVRVTILAVENQ
jgi:hypothetical protein